MIVFGIIGIVVGGVAGLVLGWLRAKKYYSLFVAWLIVMLLMYCLYLQKLFAEVAG